MNPKTRSFSLYRNEKLADPDRAARYLTAAYNESTEAFVHALKNVIQAHSVSAVARNAGVAREGLYRTENPTLVTLRGILGAVGLKIPGFEPLNASATVVPPTRPPATLISRNGKRRGTRGVQTLQQLRFDFNSLGAQTAAATADVSAQLWSFGNPINVGAVTGDIGQSNPGAKYIPDFNAATIPAFIIGAIQQLDSSAWGDNG